jgi:hypothetical protein
MIKNALNSTKIRLIASLCGVVMVKSNFKRFRAFEQCGRLGLPATSLSGNLFFFQDDMQRAIPPSQRLFIGCLPSILIWTETFSLTHPLSRSLSKFHPSSPQIPSPNLHFTMASRPSIPIPQRYSSLVRQSLLKDIRLWCSWRPRRGLPRAVSQHTNWLNLAMIATHN